MSSGFLTYISETLIKPSSFVWVTITGLASVLAFIGIGENLSASTKGLTTCLVAVVMLLFGLFFQGYRLFVKTMTPTRIRAVVEGAHRYKGKQIIVLNRAPWISSDQVLTLVDSSQDVRTPICLLRVETFTSKGHAQCKVWASLTDVDLCDYLSDQARWSNLTAIPAVSHDSLWAASK